MAKLEFKEVLARLNPCMEQAMNDAAASCVNQAHLEVTVEHLLLALIETGGCDFRIILSEAKIDALEVKKRLEMVMGRFSRAEVGRRPKFSPILMELLEDALLLGSGMRNFFRTLHI